MRIFGRIILVLLPVLFVIGIVRLYVHSVAGYQGEFVPTWSMFVAWFDSFPDIASDWKGAISRFDASSSLCPVTDDSMWGLVSSYWCNLWNNFTGWWEGFGSLVGVIVSVPFRVLGWFFSILTI